MEEYEILNTVSKHALNYLNQLPERRVSPDKDSLEMLAQLNVPLPQAEVSPQTVIETLQSIGSINTVASNGGRFFGFVFGGAVPSSLAASWLVSAWDQNAAFKVSSPIAAQIEKVTATWLLDLLHLPPGSAVGFVTGTTMANFSAAITARYHLCKRLGWDIKSKGMNGAPKIRVI